jgi:ABC-2 type transport system permease protein
MFKHIFVYRLKCLLGNRMLVFWTFLYPIVLATLFSLAFSNLSSADAFSSVPIAVVNNAEYQSDTYFQSALDSVSDNSATAKQKLFHVTVETQDHALQSLDKNEIAGYILLDGGAHVVVRESGVGQTILKEFVDSYLQRMSASGTILQNNPAAAQNLQMDIEGTYIREVAPVKTNPDKSVVYYYALIAMAALFGGFWGNHEITDIQADQSPQGARVGLAPVHKLKSLVSSFSASILMQFAILVAVVAYMGFALKVDFGGQLPFVLLACLVGSVMGVSYGAFIGAVTRKSNSLKIAVLVSTSLAMSFLAGMMVSTIKYAAIKAVPALAYLNPANLMSDAFYSLYYYTGYARYFTNIGLLLAFSAVFCLAVYFITRRQKYASL